MRRHTHFLHGLVTVASLAMLLSTVANAQVVINEFVYDDASTDNQEFIELYNAGGSDVDLTSYTLDLYNGNGGAVSGTITLPGDTIVAGGFYVIGFPATNVGDEYIDYYTTAGSPQNGAPDAIALLDDGVVVDAVAYETGSSNGLQDLPAAAYEGSGILGAYSGLTGVGRTATSLQNSVSRIGDGVDTDDNDKDFAQLPATPGRSNSAPKNVKGIPYVNNFDDAAGTTYSELWGRWTDGEALDPTTTDSINYIAGASPQGGNIGTLSDLSGGGNNMVVQVAPSVDQQIEAYVYIDSTVAPAGEYVGWTIALGSCSESYYPLGSGSYPGNGLASGFGLVYGNNIGTTVTPASDTGAVSLDFIERYNGVDNIIGSIPVSSGVNDGWQRVIVKRVGTTLTGVVGGTYGDGGVTGVSVSGTGEGLATGVNIGFREFITANNSWLLIDALKIGLTNEVTVDATDGAPDNVSTFNSLQMAVHSFQTTGAVTAASPGGLGVNNALPGVSVINVLNTGQYDEVFRIDNRSASVEGFCELDKDMVINGQGAIDGIVDAPSASANSVVRPQIASGEPGNESSVIYTDVNLTFNNMTFIPSATAAGSDDMFHISRITPSMVANTVEFNSCVFTTYNASGDPIVNSKMEALTGDVADIATPDTDLDEFIYFWPGAGESMTLNMNDCVLGYTPQTGGVKDCFIDLCGDPTPGSDGYEMNFKSSIFTHANRYGIQLAGNGAAPDPALWTMNITGDSVGDGPTDGLGGPSFLVSNSRGMQSFLGGNTGILNIDNTIVADNGARGLSLDNDVQAFIDETLIYNGVPVVYENEAVGGLDVSWTNSTIAGPSGILFGGDNGSSNVVTIADSILYRPGGLNPVSVFGVGDVFVDIDDTLINTLDLGGGTLNTTYGAGVVDVAPCFVSLNHLSADFLDVSNSAAPNTGGADDASSGVADTCWEIADGDKADVFDLADGALQASVDTDDLLTSVTGTKISGGFHPATPGDDTSRIATLTDGDWTTETLTVIAADEGTSLPSLVLEYDFTTDLQTANIDSITVFSGHDAGGDRAFINVGVEVDTGSGYAPLTTLLTGPFGRVKPNASSVAAASFDAAADVTGVEKIRFTVETVSHSSIGYFQDPDDNTTNPPANYPNQGTILKEIDVVGTFSGASVEHWDVY